MRRGAICALAALALTGCATAYQAKMPVVESGANCVDALPALPAHVLAPVDPKVPEHKLPYVEFADVAGCYRTTAGTTPLAVYRIEGLEPPAQADVSVQLNTGGTFAAAVEVLDAEFRSLRRYDFDAFVRRGNEYSLTVFLNAGTQPRYLMLLPDPTKKGQLDTAFRSTVQPLVIPAGPVMFVYHSGNEVAQSRPFLEGGRIRVLLKPQGSAAFQAER